MARSRLSFSPVPPIELLPMTVTPTSSTQWFLSLYQSSIGKKLLTGITGIAMASFVLIHMLGNLTLLFSAEAFNSYGAWLETVKPLVWSIELILAVAIALHATLGIQIYLNKRNARPIAYENYMSVNQQAAGSAEIPSFQTLSSRTMIGTGLTLAAFIVWHLVTFKFGPHYEVMVDGHAVRDLARLVIETFQQPLYTLSYVGLITLLGFHLRHGLWSALQSVGALGKGMQVAAFGASLVMAVAIAAGFILLPLTIYFGWVS